MVGNAIVNHGDDDAILDKGEFDDKREENETQNDENDEIVGNVSKNEIKKETNEITKQLKENEALVVLLGKEQSKITPKHSHATILEKMLNEKLIKFCSFCKKITEGMDSLMLQVMKLFGVEIEANHGGSLNGKCIK